MTFFLESHPSNIAFAISSRRPYGPDGRPLSIKLSKQKVRSAKLKTVPKIRCWKILFPPASPITTTPKQVSEGGEKSIQTDARSSNLLAKERLEPLTVNANIFRYLKPAADEMSTAAADSLLLHNMLPGIRVVSNSRAMEKPVLEVTRRSRLR